MALTEENFKKELKERYGNKFEFLGEFIKPSVPIKCKCNTCGHIWNKAPYELIVRGTGCPKCAEMQGLGKKKAFTQKDYENKLISLFGENPYEFITPFVNYKTRIKVKHKKCGYEFEAKPSNLTLKSLKHPTCSNCLRNNHKMTTKKYQKKLDDFFGKDKSYDILEEYVDANTAIKHRCRICNYEWKTSPANISGGLYGHSRVCPSCNNMKRDDFNNLSYKDRLAKINPNIIPLEDYITRKTKILHKCLKCNNEWYTVPSNPLSGEGCPKCANKITQTKFELKLIKDLKNIVDSEIIEKDRKILNGKELDIYIPDKKLAIKVNGLYWHCDEYKDKNYHINKTNDCKNQGIQLIHIFDDENYDVVLYKIKDILNLNKTTLPNINTKDCYIEEISKDYTKQFLEENSLLKIDNSSIRLGLWFPKDDGDELVSIMTFKSKNNNYQITRYCDCINYYIDDSFNYLFEYFKNNYNYNKIEIYEDNRYLNQVRYINNGFKFDRISKPNYFYFNRNNGKRYNRFEFQKQMLKDKFPDIYSDDKTEFQIMDETKIYKRIYDCGYSIFVYNK